MFRISDNAATINNPGSNFVRDPVSAGGGRYKVMPHDPSVDGYYEFYVHITADGGATFTSAKYVLIIGCPKAIMSSAQNALFISYLKKEVGDSKIDAYNKYSPILYPNYCPYVFHSFFNIVHSIYGPLSYGITLSILCPSTDCLMTDVTWNDEPYTLTFQI